MAVQRQIRKDFPSMREYREGHAAWLQEFGWSPDYAWHDQPHAACKHVPGGRWRLQSYGYYLAADWKHRLYQSHRCSKCGMLVQHNQVCDNDGKPEGLIMRLVVIQ